MPSLPVADPWFTTEQVGDDVTKVTEPHVARLFRANIFLVKGRDQDLLVDTGMGVANLRAALAPLLDKPFAVFTTHVHLDHVGGHRDFADCEILVHPAEADLLRAPAGPAGLSYAGLDQGERESFQRAGFDTSGHLVDAVPHVGYDLGAHAFTGIAPTRLVEEGDTVDLGSRRFEVLHLPGHSPGSAALWEPRTGTLIAGDAVYDGVLVDTMAGASIPDYLRTMERLRRLPVQVVHGGHRASFGRDRLMAIADGYLRSRAGGTPPHLDGPRISF